MQAFDYLTVRSVPEAVTALAQHGSKARILAGGTDLIVQLRENRRFLDYVIDIKQIPEVNDLSYDAQSGLSIGAAVSCMRIWTDPTVQAKYPGIVDAVALIGGIQIQSRATVGGNLVNASPAADSIPALIVHHAVCEIAGPNGVREVAVEDFCTAPGQTVLQSGEFLVRLRVPATPPGFGAHYQRFIPRNEMDIAVVGAGAAVVLDGTRFASARVALGAVAPTPLLVSAISDLLAGEIVSEAVIEEAGKLASAAAKPINDVRGTTRQRVHLAGVLTRRSLLQAIERARA